MNEERQYNLKWVIPSKHQNTILLRKEWKQTVGILHCLLQGLVRFPPRTSQLTMVFSADACTTDNNATCKWSHLVPVILATHAISLIKMTATLYRQSNSLSWRCHIPLSFVSCEFLDGKQNIMNSNPFQNVLLTSLKWHLHCMQWKEGREEGKDRMDGKVFCFVF